MNEWAVKLKDVRRTYRTGPIEVPALRGVTLSYRRRGIRGYCGSVRFGQNHPAQHHRRTRSGGHWRDLGGRAEPSALVCR